MSSTPEEGEDGALEDAIDLPDEAAEVGGPTNGVDGENQQGSTAAHSLDGTGDAPAVESPEQDNISQGQDAESIVHYEGAVSLRKDIRNDLRGEEDTVSIPDDSPSIQVWSNRSRYTNLLKVTGLSPIFSS